MALFKGHLPSGQLGVLRQATTNCSAYPEFKIPKLDGLVQFVLDFRKLNEKLLQKTSTAKN